jgi:hypothetical protein
MAKQRSRQRSKQKARKFLEELKERRIQGIEHKKQDMEKKDQWKGIVDRYGKSKKVHIEILKPKQKNYYIYIPCDKKDQGRCVFGPLISIQKGLVDTEYKKGVGEVPIKHPRYRVCVNWSARGSHQGGPVHSYKEHMCMFSKNEKVIDSLVSFLSKYSKNKTKKTKQKKKGGGKKTNLLTKLQKDYLKMCSKAEKNKHLNPQGRYFDCETMIYNSKSGEADNQDLQFMTKWYAQSIKEGVLDFDAYDTYYKEKKSKKKKQTKRRRVN